MRNTLLHTTALAMVLAGTSLWAQETTEPADDGAAVQTEEAAPAEGSAETGAAATAEDGSADMEAEGDAASDETMTEGEDSDAAMSDDGADDGAMATEESGDDAMATEDSGDDAMTTEESGDGAMAEGEDADMAAEDEGEMAADSAGGSEEAVIPQQESQDIRGDWLLNTTVTSPDGETIGDIQDFIITEDGQVKAVVLSVGGFLGIGAKDIAVDYSKLDIQYDGDQIVLDMTREQADAAEEYQYRDKETPPPATGDMGGTGGTGMDSTGGTAGTGTMGGTAGTGATGTGGDMGTGTETND